MEVDLRTKYTSPWCSMKKILNRRDFIKLAGMLPVGAITSRFLQTLTPPQAAEKRQNVLIIVFDAFSAYNISLYGYGRNTTPNIDRLAKRGIVYHNHFAGGNFTSPGTASLLTGVLPWTHRAFNRNGTVIDPYIQRNLFKVFESHYSITYTHNPWANTFLKQFSNDIDELIKKQKFLLSPYDNAIQGLFQNDDDISSVSWTRSMKIKEEGHAYSLLLSNLYEELQEKTIKDLEPGFPRGIPNNQSDIFLLETAIDALGKRVAEIKQPFIGYFHFFPPHNPYCTSREFFNAFKNDGFTPPNIPADVFSKSTNKDLPKARTEYDEFILYADREFGRLFDQLEKSGMLNNTWVVLTSDHGEINERGYSGHMTEVLFQPLVRIPLIIFEPGRTAGMDIYEYTSAVDVLPTLAHVAGGNAPDWTEGVVIPPFAPTKEIPNRNIYTMRSSDNEKFDPLTIASISLIREGYKLHYYFGYPETPGDGLVRLYDIKSDPHELTDLTKVKPETAAEMLNELKARLKEVDAPYRKS